MNMLKNSEVSVEAQGAENVVKTALEVVKEVLPTYQFAIGGSQALGSATESSDLDLVIPNDWKIVGKMTSCLHQQGWEIKATGYKHAFAPVVQFTKGTDKIDLFMVPQFQEWTEYRGEFRYMKPELIWAARGFYASRSSKALDQLKDAGMVGKHAQHNGRSGYGSYGGYNNNYSGHGGKNVPPKTKWVEKPVEQKESWFKKLVNKFSRK